jgi:small nuclear ribonucleoprotein (snRNP)-like protein
MGSRIMTAHDMTRFWRIFTVDHGRVRGDFIVYAAKVGVHEVKPLNVTLWDDEHTWGRVVKYDDFIAIVKGDGIEIPGHMIRADVRPDIEDAMDDLLAALRECVDAFPLAEVAS